MINVSRHGRDKWDAIKKPAKQKNSSTQLCESEENEDVRIEGEKKTTRPADRESNLLSQYQRQETDWG